MSYETVTDKDSWVMLNKFGSHGKNLRVTVCHVKQILSAMAKDARVMANEMRVMKQISL
jgi:hypothetical protein